MKTVKKKRVRMGTTLIRITLIYEEECSHKAEQCNMKYMHWDQARLAYFAM
jgi:hypothetical protein